MAETNILEPDSLQKAGPDPALGIRLSAMMFLQYAIWGVWMPILGNYLAGLPAFQNADGTPKPGLIALIYMTLPIASIIGPFIGGQIADRYFAAQRFLAVSQVLGGVVLLAVPRLSSFGAIFAAMLLYNLLYAPTIGISNSITFQHWPNERFSRIRMWGSIGWIVIGWVFGILWLERIGPAVLSTQPTLVHLFYFAAGLSFIYGLMALVLPHTPPNRKGNPLAFLDAFGLMRNPNFAVMAIISFFVAMELQLYFAWSGVFLEKGMGLAPSRVGPWLTAGQICEMGMMILLPLVLLKLGFRLTMALGIAAWGLRDFIFSIGQPTTLVLSAISLHGIGFAFFFTVIFMFTDVVAPKDIKSSAQSFVASVTIGCGMLVGSLSAGPISKAFNEDLSRSFLVPAILCAVCCLAMLAGFRWKSPPKEQKSERGFPVGE